MKKNFFVSWFIILSLFLIMPTMGTASDSGEKENEINALKSEINELVNRIVSKAFNRVILMPTIKSRFFHTRIICLYDILE